MKIKLPSFNTRLLPVLSAVCIGLLSPLSSSFAVVILVDYSDSEGTTPGNWNNIVTGGVADLVDTEGNLTGFTLSSVSGAVEASTSFGVGSAPSPFDIETARNDAIYIPSANTATFTLSNLDSSLTYNIEFFGSRNSTEDRTTRFTVVGASSMGSVDLQTSGTDLGGTGIHYNNSNIASFAGVAPNGSDEISVSITVPEGTYGYLNAMQITAIPEPSALPIVVVAVTFAMVLRRRKRA